MRTILVITNGRIDVVTTTEQRRRAEDALEGVGARSTRQRVTVLAELMQERDDVTAQGLHERLRAGGERLGLATVYRTLRLLADEGVVDTLSHRPGELCYRWCGEGHHHHHLVCSSCHRVVELGDCELDPWLERISARHGFVATEHHLEVSGLCGDCR
jgi:Fur family ferric uptake transcriptional regulator